ncbi:hypothetical protein [Commensalibacter papalotli (ex Botero et al. 2024)]|uniref:hypothetical protein n=1 Tax=Commensalibacter papalotli (ex Botero et al. 2024) TaxID=2972766 RepID=UPI0022FFB316|nr:hypothetical protein [Commensalibacter papalotli (ex Botero et al. 2024)]CAI3945401.1 unnamed protein product [Commensalibacter papalotli (ex Botero et al. 2024)]
MVKTLANKKPRQQKQAHSFAHLVNARAEESDPEDQNADNNDQDNNAEDDGQNPEDPKDQNGRAKKGKKAKRAEEDDDGTNAEGDDDDIDAEDEGDDETDAEDEEDTTTAQARARERGRCAAIFGCKAAANNLALAAELAFGSNLSRKSAIRILKAGAMTRPSSPKRSKASAFDQRMARVTHQFVSPDAPHPSVNQSQAAKILQAAAGTGVVLKGSK